MTVTVIDSSIALQWVLPEPASEHALRYVRADDSLAPDIILVEAANVLAKKVRAATMDGDEAVRALGMIKAALTRLVPSEPLVARALELSSALSHPVYDCVFLACAEREGSRLATFDRPFIKRITERGLGGLLAEAA